MLKSVKVDIATSSIKDKKDDIDYFPFVDDGTEPLYDSTLGFR